MVSFDAKKFRPFHMSCFIQETKNFLASPLPQAHFLIKKLRSSIQLRALLYQLDCATILGCMRHYIKLRALIYQVACATLVHALVYCNFHKEVSSPSPNPQLEDLRKKFSLDANISCVMQETKIFHQGPPLNISVTILYVPYRQSRGSI